jgi:hypothetical protein
LGQSGQCDRDRYDDEFFHRFAVWKSRIFSGHNLNVIG